MNTPQRIMKNLLSLTGATIVANIIGVINVAFLARILGPNGFGKISFSLAVVSYFVLFASLGIDIIGIREIVRDKNRVVYYAANILFLKFILGIASALILLGSVYLFNIPLETKYLILFYGITIFTIIFYLEWVFQGLEIMEFSAIARIIEAAVYTVLLFLFIRNPRQIIFIPIILCVAQVLRDAFLLISFCKRFSHSIFNKPIIDPKLVKSILRQSISVGLSGAILTITYTVATVLLGLMMTAKDIGYYSSAYKIHTLLVQAIAIYYTAIFPVTAFLYKSSPDRFRKMIQASSRLMVIVGIPMVIVSLLFAEPIMRLLYGIQFIPGATALQVLIWSTFFLFLNTNFSRALWSCDRQNKVLYIVSTQTVVVVITCFALIPFSGVLGACISMVIGELVALVLYHIEYNKIFTLAISEYALRPLLSSLFMLLVLIPGIKYPLISLPISLFSYCAGLYITKTVSKNELISLAKFLRV